VPPDARHRVLPPRTLVDKIWDDHLVAEEPGASSVLAIDLHLVHEVTSPQAFTVKGSISSIRSLRHR